MDFLFINERTASTNKMEALFPSREYNDIDFW